MEQTTPETKNIGDANNSGHEHDNTKLFLLWTQKHDIGKICEKLQWWSLGLQPSQQVFNQLKIPVLSSYGNWSIELQSKYEGNTGI